MFTIKHKNITLNITEPKDGQYQNQDDIHWYIKKSDLADIYHKTVGNTIGEDVMSDTNSFNEQYLLEELWEDLVFEYDDIEDPEEELDDFIDNRLKKDNEIFTLIGTDMVIILLNGIMTSCHSNSRQFEFDVQGKLFWICHDLQHAKKDVASLTVYVDSDTEEKRINEAWDYSLLLGKKEPLTLEEFTELKTLFFERFKKQLNCPLIEIYFEEQLMSELEEDE